MATKEAVDLTRRWCRTARALDGGWSAVYLRSELGKYPIARVAEALEGVCVAAEQAREGARELLIGVVDLLASRAMPELFAKLHDEAGACAHFSLARLLQQPPAPSSPPLAAAAEARVPDYTGGRSLSLGERKALARRPTRASLEKLAADPHPAVIRALLANPKLVEDDVVRLAARRPALPAVQSEVARTPRWAHRVRVRMAIVLNPDTPVDVATPFLVLLTRPQLKEVFEAPYLSDGLRSAARALLLRKRALRTPGGDDAG